MRLGVGLITKEKLSQAEQDRRNRQHNVHVSAYDKLLEYEKEGKDKKWPWRLGYLILKGMVNRGWI